MKHAVSDWMEIEKQRGISVTSSVMQFNYDGYCINILDTPGHQDFSEDTYRTLMAADSAVMVIDASKGVEQQTIKLFKVCLLRDIPIFTFINKMDREAKSPYELMEDIERVLGIQTYPVNWPIGSGKEFKGVYDRTRERDHRFQGAMETAKRDSGGHRSGYLGRPPAWKLMLGAEHTRRPAGRRGAAGRCRGRIRHGAGPSRVSSTPVFFGSALTNFGVEPFLEDFLQHDAAAPVQENGRERKSTPLTPDFSAFVFKIQANMNKAHRDRIAFMRICSGRFEKNMEVFHVQGGRKLKLQSASAADGAGPGNHRGGLRRGYHRRVRPRHLLHWRHHLYGRERASVLRGFPLSRRSILPWYGRWIP